MAPSAPRPFFSYPAVAIFDASAGAASNAEATQTARFPPKCLPLRVANLPFQWDARMHKPTNTADDSFTSV